MTRVFVKNSSEYNIANPISYEDEKDVEILITDNPELVPIGEIVKDINLIPIARQLQTDHGPLDIIATDEYGDLYIIETKLYKNATRKDVRTQVLDYLAGLFAIKDDFNEFETRISTANKSEEAKKTPSIYHKDLDEILKDEQEPLSIKKNLERNFKNADYTLLVVFDRIDEKIKQVVKMNNEKSKIKMYAVSLAKYQHNETSYEMVIADLYDGGALSPKTRRDSKKWKYNPVESRARFEELLKQNLLENKDRLNKVLKFLDSLNDMIANNEAGYVDWGNSEKPRFMIKFFAINNTDMIGEGQATLELKNDGRLVLSAMRLSHLLDNPLQSKNKLIKELSNIPTFKEIQEQYLRNSNRSPEWQLANWIDYADEIIRIIEEICITEYGKKQ